MDCICHLQIPKTTSQIYVIPPNEMPFVTGIAREYKTDFDKNHSLFKEKSQNIDNQLQQEIGESEESFQQKLSDDQFFIIISCLNETLRAYWPCTMVIFIGYLLAPVTCGLSLLLPNMCIGDAKVALVKAIARQNRLRLNKKGLKMVYMQACCTSWIEIRALDQSLPSAALNEHTITQSEQEASESIFNRSRRQVYNIFTDEPECQASQSQRDPVRKPFDIEKQIQ